MVSLIRGINEHLFAVLRDVIYVSDEISCNPKFELGSPAGITNAVFHIAHANIMRPRAIRASWSAGAGIRLRPSNMITARRSGIKWGCVAWISASRCGQGAMKDRDEGSRCPARQAANQQRQYLRYLGTGNHRLEPPMLL